MTTSTFGACIDFEPSPANGGSSEVPIVPTAPQKAVSRTYHSAPQGYSPDAIGLDNLQWGVKLTGPAGSGAPTRSENEASPARNDLEMSRPASPNQETRGVEALQSISNPPINRFRMLAVSLMNFGMGLNDSALGALIPHIEEHYGIGYAVVSLIFITTAVGFITAALIADAVQAGLGRARTMVLANILLACGYIPIICTPPFPVVVCCFFLLGLGLATNLALGNVFAANLQNGTVMLGLMHGSYGLGGTLGPLIATAMVTSGSLIWSRFYIVTLAMAIFNACFAGWSFWHYETEPFPVSTATERAPSKTQDSGPSVDDSIRDKISKPPFKLAGQFSSMSIAIKSKVALLGALFIFAYQGAEVSISGWVLSFLITTRGGDPSSVGYVTAGFWGGITVGRFVLSQPAHKIGEKLFVYGVVLGAAAFQLLIWFVPNVIGDAVALAIVGLLLGPVYPCAAAVFTQSIARKQQVSGLGVISAFGSSGGAMAPFLVGLLSQVIGTFVLHPTAIGLFAMMLGCWYGIPNIRKRKD